jgi:Xaa-Pro aminopeptidase
MFNQDLLLQLMKIAGLDAIIVSSPASIVYSTGVDLYTQILIPERPVFNLIMANGSMTVIVFERERSMFEANSWVKDIRGFAEFEGRPVAILASALAEHGLQRGRVGFESQQLSFRLHEDLKKAAPRLTFQACDDLLAATRRIKTDREIGYLREIARLTDQAILKAVGESSIGDPESALAQKITANLIGIHAGSVGTIDPLVASGMNLDVAHNTYGQRRIEEGDLVRFGVKARFNGYWCLLLRTGVAGQSTPGQGVGYTRYIEAFNNTIAYLRPGLRASDVFQYCKGEVDSRGLTLISEKVGHSTGLVFRDSPVLQALDERVLEARMVLAVDFQAMDRAGNRYFVEDRVLIRENDAEVLSNVCNTKILVKLGA